MKKKSKTPKTPKKAKREKKSRKFNFIAWILLIILLTLATLFVIDKLRLRESLTNLTKDNDSLSYYCTFYKKQFEGTSKDYNNLTEEYLKLKNVSLEIGDQKELLKLQKVVAKQDSVVKSINKIIIEAFSGFDSKELSIENKNGKIYIVMQDKLLFKSGSAKVESKGIEALRELSLVLNSNPEIDIMVEGHTDNVPINTGKYEDNWDLSVARANSIVRILANEYNVYPKRITAAGKGKYFPVATNDTYEGKERNRRTEIILSPNFEKLYELVNYAN